MRKIISWEQFKEVVGSEGMAMIQEVFHDSFQDSVKLIELGNQFGIPVEYETRTKANLAHDHMKARFKNKLSNLPNVETNKWKGIFAIKFGEDAFCRIKKFLRGGQVSCTLTIQQQKFNNQLSILGFPEEPTFITLGYYADKAWTCLLGIYASCSTPDGIEWFQKLGGEGYSQLNLFDQPIVPTNPAAPRTLPKDIPGEERPKRVKGKKSPKKDTGTDTDNI